MEYLKIGGCERMLQIYASTKINPFGAGRCSGFIKIKCIEAGVTHLAGVDKILAAQVPVVLLVGHLEDADCKHADGLGGLARGHCGAEAGRIRRRR